MCSTCFFTLLFILLLVKIVSNLGDNSLIVIAFVDLPHFALLACALVVCKDCPPLAAFIVRAVNAQISLRADIKNCVLNFADCRNRFFQFSFHSAWYCGGRLALAHLVKQSNYLFSLLARLRVAFLGALSCGALGSSQQSCKPNAESSLLELC